MPYQPYSNSSIDVLLQLANLILQFYILTFMNGVGESSTISFPLVCIAREIELYLTKLQEHAKVEPGVTEAEALFSWVEAFQNDTITKYVVVNKHALLTIGRTYTGLDQDDELQGVYEEDLSSLESATMLLETFAFDSERVRLCLADQSRLDVLLSFAETNELPRAYLESADNTTVDEWSKIFEECKSAVGKCIVGISSRIFHFVFDSLINASTGEDKLMNTLFDHGKGSFVQRMLIWLNNDQQRLNISGSECHSCNAVAF